MIMCQKFYIFLLLIIFLHKVLPDNVTTLKTISSNKYIAATPDPDDEDEDDLDEDDDDSSEIDDDGRVYRFKNPRNSPSPLCPRNDEQASLFGQKCLRKCSADDDCKSKKKKCLCDGACGMSCIKPDRECADLPEIELGTVSVTGRLFGDKATYTCQHGYHVVGLPTRTCQADGGWAGNAPACKQNIYCLAPPTITNARHNGLPEQTAFDLDSTIQYYCNMGYETNGFPRAKCLSMDGQASWYGPDINCEPKACGPPSDIPHGWHAGDCYTYGCRVQYTCAEGFELVGKKERFCEADGNWSPKELPTCVLVTAVQCSPPANPANGKAIYTSCSYNSVVSYECIYGYVLVGEATRRCGADKKWTGKMPICKEIICGNPGRLWNGWLENIEGGTGLGATIIFRCNEGMKLEGHSSTVCQIDGKWRYPLPNCSAPCVVPHVQQGRVYLISHENGTELQSAIVHQTLVQHGEELGVECQPQYEFLSNQNPVTCNNGTWTHIPRCEPARCKHMPRSPRNGMVIAPKTDHGMKAIFKCKDGFTLKGNYFVECSYGNWTGEIPYCQEVYCPFPGYIDNGKVLLVGNMGLYDYRPYVRKVTNNKQIMYDCDKGYVLGEGPPGATCVGGRWSPKQLPRCLPGQHPRLRWSRRRRSTDRYREKLNRSLFARQFLKNYLIYHKIPLTYLQRPINFEHVFYDLQNSRFKRQAINSRTNKLHRLPIQPHCQNYRFCIPRYMAQYRPGLESIKSSKFNVQYGHINRANHTGDGINLMVNDTKSTEELPKNVNSDQLLLEESNQQLIRNHSVNETKTFLKRSLLSISEDDEEFLEREKRSLLSRNNQHTNHVLNRNQHGGTQSVRRGDRNRGTINKQNVASAHNVSQNKIKKHRAKGPCEILSSEPYVTIDILKTGRDPNISYSSGTVVRVTCGIGYGLNLPLNATVKCVRGLWKPLKPECEILPCNVPSIENGYYRFVSESNGVQQANILLDNSIDVLNETVDVENGKVVKFSCNPGYNIKGPTNLKCWHGDWAVTTFPECIPAPCELPSIHNGQYLNGYRAGLTIGNGSFVNYQCDTFYRKTNAQPIQCILGELSPKNPGCRLARPSLAGSGILAGVNLKNLTDDLQYRAGSDISQNGGLDFVEKVNSRSCGRPARVQGANLFKDGEPMLVENDEDTYPEGTEVTFDCVSNALGEKTTWRIICEDGSWIGRSLNCENEEPPVISAPQYAVNTSCTFRNNEPNVVSFYNDQEIREDVVEFPPGVVLVSRCADIGKYAMVGPNSRRCIGPDWDGQKPACFGLNQENDYAMEKPPTVLFRHQLGPIAQSNDGKLIVYPGTILHMECLWIRRFGNPKWNISHSYRKYPEGWSTDPGRDSGLEFRLSIFHASKDDSGTFTCVTPARQAHSVEVVVKPVHCPQPPLRKGVVINNKNTKMNTKLQLSCHNSNALIGASEITCLPSGNWSHPFPICENVECGDVFAPSYFNSTYGDELSLANLRVVIVSREVGGRAVFSCTPGFGLRGPGETVCLSSGEWALPFPTCIEVHCDPPGVPENGYIQGAAPYKAGDIVQFNCNPDFMMEGQPIIACQDNARWSGTIPKCVQACSYPGTTISGRMSAVKFYYKIGETITFSCDEGLILRGAPMLRCLKNGKWSNAIPTCVNSTTSLTQIIPTTKRSLPKSEQQILFNY